MARPDPRRRAGAGVPRSDHRHTGPRRRQAPARARLMLTLPYREVWAIDTEYNLRPSVAHFFPADPQPEGSIQHPVCLVARELYSGPKVELCEGDFGSE